MYDALSKWIWAYDIGVWLAGLILLLPVAIFGLAYENQTVLPTRTGSTPARICLPDCADRGFNQHSRTRSVLELASQRTLPRHSSLCRFAGSRTLHLSSQSCLRCCHRMPADRTRTISHSSTRSDYVDSFSALGASRRYPLGLKRTANRTRGFLSVIAITMVTQLGREKAEKAD
jgi:hypothetical protein